MFTWTVIYSLLLMMIPRFLAWVLGVCVNSCSVFSFRRLVFFQWAMLVIQALNLIWVFSVLSVCERMSCVVSKGEDIIVVRANDAG